MGIALTTNRGKICIPYAREWSTLGLAGGPNKLINGQTTALNLIELDSFCCKLPAIVEWFSPEGIRHTESRKFLNSEPEVVLYPSLALAKIIKGNVRTVLHLRV